MTRILLAALTSAALAAAVAAPAFADDTHRGQDQMHHPMAENRMAAHHHPMHCTIRHHHRICR